MRDVAFVALGSNLGDRGAYLNAARVAIAKLAEIALLATSRVEETASIGESAQSPYLNQMVAIATSLTPDALLARLQLIERHLGRVRAKRWHARTIDLDIVRFGESRHVSRTLVLPHPGLAHRAFWQRELAELELLLLVAV